MTKDVAAPRPLEPKEDVLRAPGDQGVLTDRPFAQALIVHPAREAVEVDVHRRTVGLTATGPP